MADPTAQKGVQDKLDLYDNSKRYYQTSRDNWTKFYKQYRSILDAGTSRDYYKWRSKLFIPATARAVDGWLADIVLALFSPNPFFNLLPREEADVEQARLNETLETYQFEQANFFMKFLPYLFQLGIYGTTFGKNYWLEDKRTVTVKERQEFMGVPLGEPKTKKKTITLYNNPIFEPIDIFNISVSPSATSLEDTWIFQRSEKTLGECKRMAEQGIYKNVSEMENLIMSDVDSGNVESRERKLAQGFTGRYGDEKGDLRKIEILEFWNEGRTKTCTIGGGKVFLKPMRTSPFLEAGAEEPFDPFVSTSLWGLPFELFGIGICEKSADLQDHLNSEVNQRKDNNNLRQNMIVKIRRGANVNTRSITSRPGGIWLTDDMGAIEPVVIPEVGTQVSFAEENLLSQRIEEVTGVTRYSTGSGAAGKGKTATESSILARAGSKGFALMIKKIEETALKPIIRKFYQLNQLFMDEERVIRIAGDKAPRFIKIPPLETGKEFDIQTAAASELVDKGLKAQQMIQFFQMNQGNPIVQQNLLEKIYTLWGEKDFAQLNIPSEQMQEKMQQQQQQMQQAKQQAMIKAVTQGGKQVPPTGMRAGTPQEGGVPMPMGGGGVRP
jgi:hypothetical protein